MKVEEKIIIIDNKKIKMEELQQVIKFLDKAVKTYEFK